MATPTWTHLLLQPRAVKGHLEEYMGCTCQSCNSVMSSAARMCITSSDQRTKSSELTGALDEAVGRLGTMQRLEI